MFKPRIYLLIFSESFMREDVFQARKPIQNREIEKVVQALSEQFDVIGADSPVIRSKRDGIAAAHRANQSDAAAAVLYIPTFINTAMVVHTAAVIQKPIAMLYNQAPDSMSQLGFLAVGGAMEQVGIPIKRITADGSAPQAIGSLVTWARAAHAAEALKGQVYGCVGGRSLGISTGVADLAQWEKQFGVDIEHIDQLELVLRAEKIPEAEIDHYIDYTMKAYGEVQIDENSRFRAQNLCKMAASYLAMRSIAEDYELDFCGIKCQTELSNGYCLQCYTVQMLNDPYDADGSKEPFVCSCEADADGALSMQILKLISGGKPTALQDIASITGKGMVLANCGSMASYFAGLSSDPAENTAKVHLMEHGFGTAGGASTQFVAAPAKFTYMRLSRRSGRYHMGMFRGETYAMPREELKKYSPYRPTSFVRHHIDIDAFMETFCSNHLHCVEGDHMDSLVEFCKLKDIAYTIYEA